MANEDMMIDNRAPLSILTFKAKTLNANFSNCIKNPGIYGSIKIPVELLDTLIIKDGMNVKTVRFAAQFRLNQIELNNRIKEGFKIELSENLELNWRLF